MIRYPADRPLHLDFIDLAEEVVAVEISGEQLATAEAGATRSDSTATVVEGPWGTETGSFGLGLAGETPIGPASFDVAEDGSIVVADQVNDRFVHHVDDSVRTLPADLSGEVVDVLTTGSEWLISKLSPQPELHVFSSHDGSPIANVELVGVHAVGDLHRDDDGTVWSLSYPDETWLRVAEPGGSHMKVPEADRQARARHGRPSVDEGLSTVLSVRPDETRIGFIDSNGVLKRALVLRTPMDNGFVPIAEFNADGSGVVVQAMYSEGANETEGRSVYGVVRFSAGSEPTALHALPYDDQVELSPFGRFRLAGTTLYQARADGDSYRIVKLDLS